MEADGLDFSINCSFGGCKSDAVGWLRVPDTVHPDCRMWVCDFHVPVVRTMVAETHLITTRPELADRP